MKTRDEEYVSRWSHEKKNHFEKRGFRGTGISIKR